MAATASVPSASPVSGSRSFLSRLREGDEIARLITFLFAASVVVVTLLLIFELWRGSALARRQVWLPFFLRRGLGPVFCHVRAPSPFLVTLVTATVGRVVWRAVGNGGANL